LHAADLGPAYLWLKRFLQHLQLGCSERRWVLKSPDHVYGLVKLQRLGFLRRINEGESDPDLLFDGVQHFDYLVVDNTRYASADRLLLQASSVRGGFGSFLTENGKSTKEDKQGDELADMRRFPKYS
jgi:hypothetical protein